MKVLDQVPQRYRFLVSLVVFVLVVDTTGAFLFFLLRWLVKWGYRLEILP